MVFNQIYDSTKGLKNCIFCVILIILLFLGQLIAIGMRDNKYDTSKLSISNNLTGKVITSTYHGHLIINQIDQIGYWFDEDTLQTSIPIYHIHRYDDIISKLISEGEYHDSIYTFTSDKSDVDVIGFFSSIWGLLTFSIIPFPINIIPIIFSIICLLYIGFFIISIVTGFIPDWL